MTRTIANTFVHPHDLKAARKGSTETAKAAVLTHAATVFGCYEPIELRHEAGSVFELVRRVAAPGTDITGVILARMPLRRLLAWITTEAAQAVRRAAR